MSGFEMRVEDVFHITGRGYVVTGRLTGGPVRVGDAVVARTSGGEQRCNITGIHVGKDPVQEAAPDQDVGLVLRGFAPDKLQDATGVPVWQGGSRVELTLHGGDSADSASTQAPAPNAQVRTIEESIARSRPAQKPWWRFW
jgi:hypothetical protein